LVLELSSDEVVMLSEELVVDELALVVVAFGDAVELVAATAWPTPTPPSNVARAKPVAITVRRNVTPIPGSPPSVIGNSMRHSRPFESGNQRRGGVEPAVKFSP
jgi:hypothetical protein